jgi:hypothetical protein
MAHDNELLERVHAVGLTEADWVAINWLMRVYKSGGADALDQAFSELTETDPIKATAVIEAFLKLDNRAGPAV